MGTLGLEGGCHCGSLRYRTRALPVESGYCHCRTCQRTTGAPVLTWTSIPVGSFDYVVGSPKIYRSSPGGQREFCDRCGAQIAFRQDAPSETVDLNAATLDEPERIQPSVHIWTDSRIPWFDTSDDLPRFPRDEPEDEPGPHA